MIRRLGEYPVLLSVVGVVLLVAAAFTVSVGIGLAVAGIGCLVLEWRITS